MSDLSWHWSAKIFQVGLILKEIALVIFRYGTQFLSPITHIVMRSSGTFSWSRMRMRVEPLGLSTWAKSASQGWIFLDLSGISETRGPFLESPGNFSGP